MSESKRQVDSNRTFKQSQQTQQQQQQQQRASEHEHEHEFENSNSSSTESTPLLSLPPAPLSGSPFLSASPAFNASQLKLQPIVPTFNSTATQTRRLKLNALLDRNTLYELSAATFPSADTIKTRLPYYVPILFWLPSYDWTKLPADALAGATVAVMVIPQSIAYASLTGLPPLYGLMTCFFPLLIYFLLGTSKQLAVGVECTTSILLGHILTKLTSSTLVGDTLLTPDSPLWTSYMVQYAAMLTLLTGIITLLFGLFRVGFVDSILSQPILDGFVIAVAGLLVVDQTPKLIGLSKPYPLEATSIEKIEFLWQHLHSIHLPTLYVSVIAVTALIVLKYVKYRFPHSRTIQCLPEVLILVITSTLVSYLGHFSKRYEIVCLGKIEYGFLPPSVPLMDVADITALLPSALSISVLGFVQSQIPAKLFAAKNGDSISANRELVALGMGSLIGSFFGAWPAYGSLLRTKVNENAGATSQFAGLFTAGVMGIAIMFILPLFAPMPKAVVGSIIFVVALSLFDFQQLYFLYRLGAYRDALCMCAMMFITFVFGIEVGVFFAFTCCLLLLVKQINVPDVSVLGLNVDDNEFYAVSDSDVQVQTIEDILIIRVDGVLHFANAGSLKQCIDRLEQFSDMHAHPSSAPTPYFEHVSRGAIIFEMSGLTQMDSTAVQVFRSIVETYAGRGTQVCVVSRRTELLQTIELADCTKYISAFRTLKQAVMECQQRLDVLKTHQAQHTVQFQTVA